MNDYDAYEEDEETATPPRSTLDEETATLLLLGQTQDDLQDLVRGLQDLRGDVEEAWDGGFLDADLCDRLMEMIDKADTLAD